MGQSAHVSDLLVQVTIAAAGGLLHIAGHHPPKDGIVDGTAAIAEAGAGSLLEVDSPAGGAVT